MGSVTGGPSPNVTRGGGRYQVGRTTLSCVWAAATDRGLVRAANQDAVLVGELAFAVCDGMGGHTGGEVASRLAVGALVNLPHPDRRSPGDVLDGFRAAQDAVRAAARSRPELAGMGSTGTLVAVCPGESGVAVVVANVGDTRAYIADAGGFRQVSVDHTVVQELIEQGVIEPAAAVHHQDRSVLTRAIGGEDPLDIDVRALPLGEPMRVVLTSDGVHSYVSPGRLATLSILGAPPSVVDRVLTAGLAEGGPDNLSCVVVDLAVVADGNGDGAADERTVPRTSPEGRDHSTDVAQR